MRNYGKTISIVMLWLVGSIVYGLSCPPAHNTYQNSIEFISLPTWTYYLYVACIILGSGLLIYRLARSNIQKYTKKNALVSLIILFFCITSLGYTQLSTPNYTCPQGKIIKQVKVQQLDLLDSMDSYYIAGFFLLFILRGALYSSKKRIYLLCSLLLLGTVGTHYWSCDGNKCHLESYLYKTTSAQITSHQYGSTKKIISEPGYITGSFTSSYPGLFVYLPIIFQFLLLVHILSMVVDKKKNQNHLSDSSDSSAISDVSDHTL